MNPEEVHTFLFADLAGFTALTEAHGDAEAADLVAEFTAEARELLTEHRAREVKTIGDAVMVACSDAASAVRLGLHLAHDLHSHHRMPCVRVGMHTGPAVEQDGDFIGAAVNVAARVSGLAGGDEVIISEATRDAAGPMPDVTLHALGTRRLKNVGTPPALFQALWSSKAPVGEHLPIDPVCRMAVAPDREAGRFVYEGTEFHFCSLDCARAFTADPSRYITA